MRLQKSLGPRIWSGVCILSILVASLLLPAPVQMTSAAQAGSEWSIFIYMAADNTMNSSFAYDINELSQTSYDQDTNIVILKDTRLINDTEVIVMEPSGLVGTYTDQIWPEKGRELNLADGKVLEDFLLWGIDNYPAQHYFTLFWDHGYGWDGVCDEDDKNDILFIQEMMDALGNVTEELGRPLDIVGFDACFMMSIEVLWTMESVADYIVGSEKEFLAEGWNYHRWLGSMQQLADRSPRNVAMDVVESNIEYYDDIDRAGSLSAIETAHIPEMRSAVFGLSQTLYASLGIFWDEMGYAQAASFAFDFIDQDGTSIWVDLVEYCEKVNYYVDNPQIVRASERLNGSLESLIVASETVNEEYGGKGINGLSVYFPRNNGLMPSYSQCQFAIDTYWDELIFYTNVQITTPVSIDVDISTSVRDGDVTIRAKGARLYRIEVDLFHEGEVESHRPDGNELELKRLEPGDYTVYVYSYDSQGFLGNITVLELEVEDDSFVTMVLVLSLVAGVFCVIGGLWWLRKKRGED